MNALHINYIAEHEKAETGERFVNVWGSVPVEGKYLEDASFIMNESADPTYAVLRRMAEKYEAAKAAGRPQDYPRGFALDAPAGWSCDWDQERKPYKDDKGAVRQGRWKVKPIAAGEGATLRLVKAPPPRSEIDAEAEAALRAAGLI